MTADYRVCGHVWIHRSGWIIFFNEISGEQKSLIFRILHCYYLFNGLLFPHLPSILVPHKVKRLVFFFFLHMSLDQRSLLSAAERPITC